MKKLIALVAVALLVPSVALAKGPGSGKGSHGGKAAPKVQYILKGTLSGYVAADGGTNGSITIAVTHSNHHGRGLKGQTLTIPVASSTKVTLHSGMTTIADDDRGIVKVKAAKKLAASDLLSTIEASNARQIVDQGAASSG
jgi:hypothetical protein